MGFCLWSTGVCMFSASSRGVSHADFVEAQTDFARRLAAKLPEQTNKHALETDAHCRVIGTPLGDVYAVGDCATLQNNVSDHIVTFLRTLAWEKGKDPESLEITYSDWRQVARRVKQRFPQAADHLRRLDRLFMEYDRDKSGTLDFGELSELLRQIDSKLTTLPATAQRAHQQGEYLGKKFNKIAQAAPGMRLNEVDYGDLDEAIYKAFEYHHLGSLAYVGNSAIFDVSGTGLDATGWKGFAGNLWAVYLWRSVYFAQSVSFRTRCLLAMDWTKRALFGRGKDIQETRGFFANYQQT
jgi:NADH:ubiquinone reductase (H+-translocating)